MKSIAVVVPAYNAERTISDCLRSIKMQTIPTFLVVVNDASTDSTGILAEHDADLVVTNFHRMGKAWSVNHALTHIQHDYTLVVDADTYLERQFIQKLAHALNGHNFELGSGYAKYIGRNKFARHVAKAWTEPKKDSWRYNGCCQFFRTELLREEGYNEETFVEDEEIFWRLQHKKGVLVDAIAYSEAPLTIKAWLKQQLRWTRGRYQLARWNLTKCLTHKYRTEIFGSLIAPILLLAGLTWSILRPPSTIFGLGAAILLLAVFMGYEFNSVWMLRYFPHVLLASFLPVYTFFEVFLFNRKFKPTSW